MDISFINFNEHLVKQKLFIHLFNHQFYDEKTFELNSYEFLEQIKDIDFIDVYNFFEANQIIIYPRLYQSGKTALYIPSVIYVGDIITVDYIRYFDLLANKSCWYNSISEETFKINQIKNEPLDFNNAIEESIKFAVRELGRILEVIYDVK